MGAEVLWNLTTDEVLNTLAFGFMRGLLLVGCLCMCKAVGHATRRWLHSTSRHHQVRNMRRSRRRSPGFTAEK
jgi:hypothetical protein